jgi:acetyl-CoA carboxylase carboxyltransferase component
MVKGAGGIFLAGPYLVKAAIGEETDAETLGGAATHARLSGMADYTDETEQACLARVRRLAAQWPTASAHYPMGEARAPAEPADRILDVFPADRRTAYDTRALLRCIVDADSWEEYKADFGQSLLTATARLEGRTIGIVGNQRLTVRSGEGEMQIGGVIYADAADKAARFVLNCNQKSIPLLFIQDVTGFMVGTRAERGGIIKSGAKLVNAVSNSRVPKITLVIGNSYGAGNYALCGRAYDPRFMIAWPTARIAVMGGDQAANTILQVEKGKAREDSDPEKERALLERIRGDYEATTTPYHAAAHLIVDAIVDPRRTRETLDHLLRIACRRDPPDGFNLGVFQV